MSQLVFTASTPDRHRLAAHTPADKNETELMEGELLLCELTNGKELFAWIADAHFPFVATGDFHEPHDLASWKTFIPCRRSERAVLAHLRSRAPVYVMPYAPDHALPAREAA
jgi:hypothetical protein